MKAVAIIGLGLIGGSLCYVLKKRGITVRGVSSPKSLETAQRMGMKPVAHIKGGFSAWKKAGGPVDLPELAPGEKK